MITSVPRRVLFALIFTFACLAVGSLLVAWGRPSRADGGTKPGTSCTSTSPCQEYDNTSSGAGLAGTSAKGDGLEGTTNAKSAAGVLGADASSGTKSSGVLGMSTNGVGVVGETSFNGSTSLANGKAGVNGKDQSTLGTFNAGMRGFSLQGFGMVGISQTGTGVFGQINKLADSSRSAVVGQDNVSQGFLNTGVTGTSLNGIGTYGTAHRGVGVSADGGDEPDLATNTPALSVSNNGFGDFVDFCFGSPRCLRNIINGGPKFTIDNAGDIFATGPFTDYADDNNPTLQINGGNSTLIAAVGAGGTVLTLDNSGNLHIAGQIFTSGFCSTGCVKRETSDHASVTAYTPNQTMPSIEDFGKGQLVGGQARVALDPAFARTIDPRSEYLVFLTPEGDNRGLFVTDKTPSGFAVRESMGGRSTIAFDYRIVAKPFNDRSRRLPMWTSSTMGGKPYVRPRSRHH